MRKTFLRITVWMTLVLFSFNAACWPQPAFSAIGASGTSVPAEEIPLSPEIPVPLQFGRTEMVHFKGPGRPFVFLIQDAHAALDAQKSIQFLLEHLRAVYNVRLVALEGGVGPVDGLLFQTFPDPHVRDQVLEGYLRRGELTGAEMAAARNPDIHFVGMEDWKLYERNYLAYLGAVAKEERALQVIFRIRKKLDAMRRRIYSKAHNLLHERWQAFEADPSTLNDLLRFLKKIPTFGHHLADFPELERLANYLAHEDEANGDVIRRGIKAMTDRFHRKVYKHLPPNLRKAFNAQLQAYQSEGMDPGQFLDGMIHTARSVGLRLDLTPELKSYWENFRQVHEIKSTRIYEELEEIRSRLEREFAVTPEQKRLKSAYERLSLMKRLACLELSSRDFERYRQHPEEYLELMEGENSAFLPALAFYHWAVARDKAFYRRILKFLDQATNDRIAVVAGGFHTRHLERLLAEGGLSYAVITPRIFSIEEGRYERIMQASLSYRDYLETTFYDAFIRHATKQLTEKISPLKRLNVIKLWRDALIRQLVRQGRLEETDDYTRYLDRLIRLYDGHGDLRPAVKQHYKTKILEAVHKEVVEFQQAWFDRLQNTFQYRLHYLSKGLKSQDGQEGVVKREVVERLLRETGRLRPSYLGRFLALARNIPGREKGSHSFNLANFYATGRLVEQATAWVPSYRAEVRSTADSDLPQDPLEMKFAPPPGLQIEALELSRRVVEALVPQLVLVFDAFFEKGFEVRAFGGVVRGLAFATQFHYTLPISEIDLAVPVRAIFTEEGWQAFEEAEELYKRYLRAKEVELKTAIEKLEIHPTDETSFTLTLAKGRDWSISKFWLEYDRERKRFLLKGAEPWIHDLKERVLRLDGEEFMDLERLPKLLDQAVQYLRYGFRIEENSLQEIAEEITKDKWKAKLSSERLTAARKAIQDGLVRLREQIKHSESVKMETEKPSGTASERLEELLNWIFSGPSEEERARLVRLHQELLAAQEYFDDGFVYEDEGDHFITYYHEGVDWVLKAPKRGAPYKTLYKHLQEGRDIGGELLVPYLLVPRQELLNHEVLLPEDRGDIEPRYPWVVQLLAFSLKDHIFYLKKRWDEAMALQDKQGIAHIEDDLRLLLREWRRLTYRAWALGVILEDHTFENAGITRWGQVLHLSASFDKSWLRFFKGSTSIADLANNVNRKWLMQLFDEETTQRVYGEGLNGDDFSLLWPSNPEAPLRSRAVAEERRKALYEHIDSQRILQAFYQTVRESENRNRRAETRVGQFGDKIPLSSHDGTRRVEERRAEVRNSRDEISFTSQEVRFLQVLSTKHNAIFPEFVQVSGDLVYTRDGILVPSDMVMAAEVLQKILRPGDHLIDLGSGSGVVVFLASVLGADFATGLESDANIYTRSQELAKALEKEEEISDVYSPEKIRLLQKNFMEEGFSLDQIKAPVPVKRNVYYYFDSGASAEFAERPKFRARLKTMPPGSILIVHLRTSLKDEELNFLRPRKSIPHMGLSTEVFEMPARRAEVRGGEEPPSRGWDFLDDPNVDPMKKERHLEEVIYSAPGSFSKRERKRRREIVSLLAELRVIVLFDPERFKEWRKAHRRFKSVLRMREKLRLTAREESFAMYVAKLRQAVNKPEQIDQDEWLEMVKQLSEIKALYETYLDQMDRLAKDLREWTARRTIYMRIFDQVAQYQEMVRALTMAYHARFPGDVSKKTMRMLNTIENASKHISRSLEQFLEALKTRTEMPASNSKLAANIRSELEAAVDELNYLDRLEHLVRTSTQLDQESLRDELTKVDQIIQKANSHLTNAVRLLQKGKRSEIRGIQIPFPDGRSTVSLFGTDDQPVAVNEARLNAARPFGLLGMSAARLLDLIFHERLEHEALIKKIRSYEKLRLRYWKRRMDRILNRFLKRLERRLSELEAEGRLQSGDVVAFFFTQEFLDLVPSTRQLGVVFPNEFRNELINRIRIAVTDDMAELARELTHPDILTGLSKLSPEGSNLLLSLSLKDLLDLMKGRGVGTVDVVPEVIEKLHSRSVVMDVALLHGAQSQELVAALNLNHEDTLSGIAYPIGAPDEQVALGFSRLFSRILTIGYKASKPFRLAETNRRFTEPLIIATLDTPFEQVPRSRLKELRIEGLVTEPHLIQAAHLRPHEFVRLVKAILAADSLKNQLVFHQDLPLPFLTPEALNAVVQFINELATTDAARRLMARAA